MSKSGLIPDWTDAQIERVFDRFEGNVRDNLVEFYKYVGDHFVNKAREIRTYQDRTGNLRSSIGFVVVVNGTVDEENFEGNSTGRQEAKELASNVAGEIKGIGLIGVAGMEYAAAVEAKGYDVITGSVPSVQKLMRETLNELKNME